MNTPLLDSIKGPEDVKRLREEQVTALCDEIRRFLVDSVLRTGGHLASNLGAVELTVALHRVLRSPQDKIVFDVGHQCYTHKLLTGRKAGFARLRHFPTRGRASTTPLWPATATRPFRWPSGWPGPKN